MSEPTTQPSCTNLAQAVIAVMSEVGSLEKDGRNDFSNYSFTTEAMVVNTLRPIMVKHGLALVPHNISVVSELQIHEKMRRVAINATYLLMHSSGETLTITVPGEGMDSLDKSTAKSLTGALKYALLQTFCVGRGDDGDEGKGYDTVSENSAVRAAAAASTAPRQDDGGWVIDFGKHTGKSVRLVDVDYLKWIIEAKQKDLSDPSKKGQSLKNRKHLDIFLDEINRRAKNAQPDDLDDLPFGQ